MTTEEIDGARGCSCLSKLVGVLAAEGKDAEFNLSSYHIREGDGFQSYTDLPPLRYFWKEKRKTHAGHLPFTYCPFCGTKRP